MEPTQRFLNIGATYDGDWGNEVVLGKVTFTDTSDYATKTTDDKQSTGKTFHPYMKAKGELTFSLREPVMAESLGYFSSKPGSKTMNNVTSINLVYNFNNLRNMIKFNHAKLLKIDGQAATVVEDSLEIGTKDYITAYLAKHLEMAMTISITDAWLVIDVATAQVEAIFSYVTYYIEYRRYETAADKKLLHLNQQKIVQRHIIDSEIYSLT